MALETFKAFIFDMDGTLVDSKLDFDAMRAEMGFPHGEPILEYIEFLGDRISPEERNRYFQIVHKHELEGARRSELMEGCLDFLVFLKEQNIKTAVLTRNSLQVTDLTFSKWELEFDAVLSRDCVEKPKPHPEGLYKICESLDVLPEQSVYMGDFMFDLEAAWNAGMKAILFSPEKNKYREAERKADYVVRSFIDLKRDFEEGFLKSLNFTL